MKYLRISFFICILCAVFSAFASVTETEIFEWWDNEMISAEEANELLLLLDEGNEEELCVLAASYAGEVCEEIEEILPSKKRGYAQVKFRFDSTGHINKKIFDFFMHFYRFDFHWGAHELLSYKHEGYEAHFGDISTKEFHSQIALDTLWGSVLYFPLGNFSLGSALDTSRAMQMSFAYIKKKWALQAMAFYRSETSLLLQSKFPLGAVAFWQELGQKAPLVKLQLREKAKPFSWNTTLYFHEEDVPTFAKLSSTILKSRFWGTQNFTANLPLLYKTKISFNSRFLNPLNTDSLSTRLRGVIESGPEIFRPKISMTCVELADHCENTDGKVQISSKIFDFWKFETSVKSRYNRLEGFNEPRLEIAATFADNAKNYGKIAFILPKLDPRTSYEIQNTLHFTEDFLQFALSVYFKSKKGSSLAPHRGNLSAKFLF